MSDRITAEEIAELRALMGRTTYAGWTAGHAPGNMFVGDLLSRSREEQDSARDVIVAAVNALPRLLDRIEELEVIQAGCTAALSIQARRIEELERLGGQPHDADWHLEPDEMKP